MRKVTQITAQAFVNKRRISMGNTISTGMELLLHGNCIARRNDDGIIQICTAGWRTATTKERINGVLSLLGKPIIYQKDYAWYRDVDGQRTEVPGGFFDA